MSFTEHPGLTTQCAIVWRSRHQVIRSCGHCQVQLTGDPTGLLHSIVWANVKIQSVKCRVPWRYAAFTPMHRYKVICGPKGNPREGAVISQVSRDKPKPVFACWEIGCLLLAGNPNQTYRHRHTSVTEERKGLEEPLVPESPPPELPICNQSPITAVPQAGEAPKVEGIGWLCTRSPHSHCFFQLCERQRCHLRVTGGPPSLSYPPSYTFLNVLLWSHQAGQGPSLRFLFAVQWRSQWGEGQQRARAHHEESKLHLP